MSEVIENCPMCGSKADFDKYEYGKDVVARCDNLDCDIQQGVYKHKDDAIKEWNTRAPTKKEVELTDLANDLAASNQGLDNQVDELVRLLRGINRAYVNACNELGQPELYKCESSWSAHVEQALANYNKDKEG